MLSSPGVVNLVPTPVIGGVGLGNIEWPVTGLVFLTVLFVLSLAGIAIEAVRNTPRRTSDCDATGDLDLAHVHRQPA